jgi:DNA-binding NtrC family response regulator
VSMLVLQRSWVDLLDFRPAFLFIQGRCPCTRGGNRAVGKSILVIDDETMILDAIKIIFEDMGYSVQTTPDPVGGTEAAIAGDFDLILTDIRMPLRNGAEITEAVLARKPKARILVITAYPNDPLAERAIKAGAVGLLKKPFEIAKILNFLQ